MLYILSVVSTWLHLSCTLPQTDRILLLSFMLLCVSDVGSHVSQAGSELLILLLSPPKCWDDGTRDYGSFKMLGTKRRSLCMPGK